ncbi:MAG: hypothetical protein JOZ57_06705, partial [Abitibacteriaceae bacterium]|nr:hypothetical protein [Abditibacteriaceae bacterium]
MFKIWKFRKWCLPLAVVGIALAGRSAAQAATVSWNNPAGGDFDEPKNWSTGAVPGNADVVAITLPGTYDVKLTFGHTVAGLVVGGTNARPTLNLNGALTVSNA